MERQQGATGQSQQIVFSWINVAKVSLPQEGMSPPEKSKVMQELKPRRKAVSDKSDTAMQPDLPAKTV